MNPLTGVLLILMLLIGSAISSSVSLTRTYNYTAEQLIRTVPRVHFDDSIDLAKDQHVNFYDSMLSAKDRQIINRQSARWSLAAKQDMNPVIGLLHANYGTGYLLFLIMNGIWEKRLFEKIFAIEKDIVRKINNKCTRGQPIELNHIDQIVQKIRTEKEKYYSTNIVINSFTLIDLIDKYASDHPMDPLIGLICANYCCGVYWAITDIMTHSMIETVLRSGMGPKKQKFKNILEVRDMLIDRQDQLTRNYSKICSHYNIGEIGDDYLAQVAGDK